MGRDDDHCRERFVLRVMGALRVSTPQLRSIDCAHLYPEVLLTTLGLNSLVRRLAGVAIKRGIASAFKNVDGEFTEKRKNNAN